MRRRDFIALICAAAAAWPFAVRGQAPAGPPRIGYLGTNANRDWAEAFARGLFDLGYVENRTIVIERRDAAGRSERLPGLAAELVGLQPQVIVAASPATALALKQATATIPLVLTNVGDPVELGLVSSLARPGGNVTGLANLTTELMGKRLELLVELVPGLSRVGVVWDRFSVQPGQSYQRLQAAAVTLRLNVESFEVTRPEDFDAAFQAAGARVGGVAVLSSPIVIRHRELVTAAAARHKVPAIYYDSEFIDAGGLVSYGASFVDLHRRAATYVDKILKGAKPGDLPIEQPTTFELVVNLKTAKALGITIPQSILVRADEVIE